MWSQKPSFRLEIDNFSEKEAFIQSQTFVSGRCEWYLKVFPKGDLHYEDHISLYLTASSPTSSQTGWKRRARFYFSLLNQSNKELYLSPIGTEKNVFTDTARSWGFGAAMPLSKLSKFQEDGLLENDKLIVEIYINIVETDDGEGEDVSKKKETANINGFQAFASHASQKVNSVRKTFTERVSKREYMNVLSNACSKVSGLAKSKLDEVSLKMKKADDADHGSQIQQHEERIKNLELIGSDMKLKLEEVSLERKRENGAADESSSQIQQLKEQIKNQELMLKLKLEEVSLERKRENDASDESSSQIQKLEEQIKNQEVMLSGFKAHSSYLQRKLEEIYLERKRLYDVDGSRVEELEERIKNLELKKPEMRLDKLALKLEEVSLGKKKSDKDYESRFKDIEDCLEGIAKELHLLSDSESSDADM